MFDLDDTLVDCFESRMPVVLRNTLTSLVGAGFHVDDFETSLQRLYAINRVSRNAKEAIKQLLDENEQFLDSLFLAGVEAYYSDKAEGVVLREVAGAKEVLSNLAKDHVLAIVSRGDERVQFDKLARVGININLFEKIIITPEYDKTVYYQQLLRDLQIDPSATLVCGDKFETDLLPAKKLGMHTVHLRWGRGKVFLPNSGEIEYSIESIKDIIPIVGHLSRE